MIQASFKRFAIHMKHPHLKLLKYFILLVINIAWIAFAAIMT